MFDFDFQPSTNVEQIMELATMRVLENKDNVIFLETPGVGKSNLVVALGMIAAEYRYKAFSTWNEIFSDINDGFCYIG